MTGHEHPAILILGPTAGGKTTLAIELALALPGGGECVCADSMQVYRGMDVGTAKPTPQEQARVPHHVLDVANPADDGFTVDAWLGLAEAAVADIRERGRWPIVVGGTNLYVQAFLAGLFDGPEPDPALRAQLQVTEASVLRERLEAVDPAAAERIHPNDRRRTIRAIEVHALTGRRISDLQQQWTGERARADVRIVGLDWPVEAINRRINARVRSMIDGGLVAEVERLRAAGSLGVQARSALGYQQILEHLEVRCTLDDAIEQIKIRTRRFAKQQRTWLRKFRSHPRSIWLPADKLTPQELVEHALTWMLGDRKKRPDGPATAVPEGRKHQRDP